MPPTKVREIVERDIRPHRIGYDDVLFLKRYFGVSTQAMLRTLRNLNFIRRERFEEFFQRDPRPREKELFGNVADGEGRGGRGHGGVKGLIAKARARTITSDRFKLLEHEAEAVLGMRRRGEEVGPEEPPDGQSNLPTE